MFGEYNYHNKIPTTANIYKNNDINKNMCDKWDKTNNFFETCNITVSINPLKQTIINGILKDPLRSQLLSFKKVYVQYWASSPSDSIHSFSGSGLPFPSEDIAYSNSPNIGRVELGKDGSFVIKIIYPNSYYNKLGSEYVKPHLKLLFNDENGNMYGKIVTILLGNGIPYRSLGNKNTKYIKNRVNDNIPFQTQFKILETSYYPNRM
jgi:hypothetical protein